MPQFFRLVYLSRNSSAGSPHEVADEVQDILVRSRANNLRDGLTGGLLFNAGCFAQVLEGPMSVVERTFGRIRQDGRHDDVTVLHTGPIERRGFPAWSMAYTGTGDDPFAAIVIRGAFRSPTANGSRVLDMMHDVVAREAEAAVT